jgi:hypothetical protein
MLAGQRSSCAVLCCVCENAFSLSRLVTVVQPRSWLGPYIAGALRCLQQHPLGNLQVRACSVKLGVLLTRLLTLCAIIERMQAGPQLQWREMLVH